jgi:hypothetical protein
MEHAFDLTRGIMIAKVFCHLSDAQLLLNYATRSYPAAVPYITEAVKMPGSPNE